MSRSPRSDSGPGELAHADTFATEPALDVTATCPGAARVRARKTDLIGTTLAHFRIVERLGEGGMGEVYMATDISLERSVAVKILPARIAHDPERRELLYHEARAQARLHHPNVCHIYFVGEQDGQTFFAMEYIEGESLKDQLARNGPIPVSRALEYCRMAALGLREAHQHGFTHRDIKPSNLMLDKHGAVKVVDFGLVKQTDELPPAASDGDGDVARTTVVGTPLYMSPEQAEGRKVDIRSDIYALGATLHELISGKPPFAGESIADLVSQHASQRRPCLDVDRRELAPLDDLCDRMMAKQPADRFASYDELIQAIDGVSPARTRPAGLWVRSTAMFIDLVLALLVVAPIALLSSSISNALTPLALLAYWTIGHARWGRTVGKALFELELVRFMGDGRVSYPRAALRFAAQWAPLLLIDYTGDALTWFGLASTPVYVVLTAIAGVWVIACVATFWRSPNRRALWDRLAGTQVRYRAADASGR